MNESSFYDDNFGHWDMSEGDEVREFYFQVQRESVETTCSICGRTVKLLPQYDKCDACTDAIEQGFGY